MNTNKKIAKVSSINRYDPDMGELDDEPMEGIEQYEKYFEGDEMGAPNNTESESYDDPGETLSERLWGLTEMFPDPVRRFSGRMFDITARSIKGLYTFTCNASWVFMTSSIILFAPVIIETARAQVEEVRKSEQKQMLLGPAAAMERTGPPKSLKK